MSKISSHTGWQPLREVWLGDVYPDHFYDHVTDPRLRDLCLHVSQITRQDLKIFQSCLESLGVQVCRPSFVAGIEAFLDSKDNLIKPPITPRDWAMTLGDTLYIAPQYPSMVQPWQTDIDRYLANHQNVRILQRFGRSENWCYITFPSVVRAGRDLYIDFQDSGDRGSSVRAVAQELAENYRVHLGTTGDHSDGVFCPIRPGHIISSHYRQHYHQGWPGWHVLSLPNSSAANNGANERWHVPGMHFPHINAGMLDILDTWIGDMAETVFEVNMLVIDHQNVLVLAYDDTVCRHIESLGMTPHLIDFRARGFWDGGLHCLTTDICREGDLEDYWPDRGPNGIYNDADN